MTGTRAPLTGPASRGSASGRPAAFPPPVILVNRRREFRASVDAGGESPVTLTSSGIVPTAGPADRREER